MRSYKDCLIGYLEERGYSELNLAWYEYLQNEISESGTDFQIFEGAPALEEEADMCIYADRLVDDNLASKHLVNSKNKYSEAYKALLGKLIESEFIKVRSNLNEQKLDWNLCESVLKFPSKESKEGFEETFRSFLAKSNACPSLANKYFDSENDCLNYLKVIDDFFNAKLGHLKSLEYKFNPVIESCRSIQIDFDSMLHFESESNHWTKQVNDSSCNFFCDDEDILADINGIAKRSDIRVTGEIDGFSKYDIQAGDWMNEALIKQLYTDKKNDLDAMLSTKCKSVYENRLNRRTSSFYCIQEFDLTIEITNSFSTEDLELLRNSDFSIFPFHFSAEHEHYKWIDLNDEGELRIRIKSKKAQQTLIAADLKIFKK